MNSFSAFIAGHKKQLFWVSYAALLVIFLATFVNYGLIIDGHTLESDAAQNVRSAVNLARFGVYGESPVIAGFEPGFRREPFPNFSLAFYLKLWDLWLPGLIHDSASVISDKLLFFAKTINLVFAAFLFIGCWVLLRQVFLSPLIANFVMIILLRPLNSCFVRNEVNNYNTELVASVLIIWLTVALLKSAEKPSFHFIFSSGLLFGLLALTKASAAYMAIFALPCIAFLLSRSFRQFWGYFLFLSIGFAMFVSPWVLRNQLEFSSPAIARGGGEVLLIRSEFNQMNNQQLRNGFYAYSPTYLQDNVLGPILDLEENDFKCGNLLDVFNRNLDCDQNALRLKNYDSVRSFYQRGKRAIPRKFDLNSEDKKELAVQKIKSDPFAHARVTMLMGWRGFWPFKSKDFFYTIINLMAFLSLIVVPMIGLYEKKRSWVVIGIVPTIYYSFYAFTSHFLPRYSEPLIPLSLVCLAILAAYIWSKLFCLRGDESSLSPLFKR